MAEGAKRKKKKPKLSSEEKKRRKNRRDHIKSVRSMFKNAGFERAEEISEKEFIFHFQKGEFDDAFIYENLLVLAEYTATQSSDVTDHLKKKKIIFDSVSEKNGEFVRYLRERFPAFDRRLGDKHHIDNIVVRIVYCSYNDYDSNIRDVVRSVVYLDYYNLKYFEKISSIIKLSAQNEIFDFLDVAPDRIMRDGVRPKDTSEVYEGSVLPESHSGFPAGYKVVSFYADPAALLQRAYVLRRDGWRGTFQAYQRMLMHPKVEAIRKKLRSDQEVFVNNIIATLPSDVHPVDQDGYTVDIATLRETKPVKVRLPVRPNSIGLIDGQHRLYSYYEARDDDDLIRRLRKQQNLLVTGIIFPSSTSKLQRQRFEAQLFISINSNQTNAKAQLRQEVEVFLDPYSPIAVGKQVMQRLAKQGPLAGQVESQFFDKGKLKTTSIVSYGLGPLIKFNGSDTLFWTFRHDDKSLIPKGESDEGLEAYIAYASGQINLFLGAVRANVSANRWTADRREKSRVITVTHVNSFLILLRLLIDRGEVMEFEHLREKLRGIEDFDFSEYRSSQYYRLAERLCVDFFGREPEPV